MNIRLLIVGILAVFAFSCSTLSETTSYNYKNHNINVISDSIVDQEFMAILNPYKDQVDSKMEEIIGFSPNGLMSYRPESPLSNFLSDMLLDVANDYSRDQNLGIVPDIALFNHGGIRSSIPKGDIRILHAYNIMPFENEIVMVLLNGQQLADLADYLTTRGGEGVAGMSFGMNEDKAENIKVGGLKVDVNKKYWIVTSDYIANGGDGMKVLTWAEKRINTGLKVRDVIISYLKVKTQNGEEINSKADGRIYHVE